MRVLVLSDHSDDKDRRERLRAIAGPDYDLILATPGGSSGSDGAVRLAPVNVKGDSALPGELRWDTAGLRKVMTETRPDLVHLEAEPDSPLAATAAKLCQKLRIPYLVFSWRSLPRSGGFFAGRRATSVLRGATGVIGGNRRAMELLHEAAPAAIAAAIPSSGVNLPAPARTPEHDGLVIGFAGRLVPERGPDLFVTALGQTYGKWRAVIAGTGPLQEALERDIQRLGLAARIRWFGGLRSDTVAALWSEIDCLVVPSRDTPTWVDHHTPILLEAMGRGIAPVVTRAGALPEMVGSAGAVADGAEGLAAALQPWVVDPAACRAAGQAARQWVLERYVTSVVARRTVEFWQAVRHHAQPSLGPVHQE